MNIIYRTLLATVALAVSSVTVSAETITVCASGCDYTSINAAIDAASDGDVIQLAAETYLNAGQQIYTDGKSITVRGAMGKNGEPSSLLKRSGNLQSPLLCCCDQETAETVIENLIIEGGYGGGMAIIGSSPKLKNCLFRQCVSPASGGAIVILNNSSPTLIGCVFTMNIAQASGGAVSITSSSMPVFSGCIFEENFAQSRGGGVNSEYESSPAFVDCVFSENNALFDGGAIHDSGESLYLSGCEFANTSGYSTLSSWFGTVSIHACSFTGNNGQAIRLYSSNADISATLFSGNYSPPHVGGSGISINGGCETCLPILTECTFTECCQIQPPRAIIDEGGNYYESWCDDCRADVNCRDNAVNASDLGILIGSWGTSDPQCDINGDGTVSAADLGLLIGAWGPCQ